MVDPYTQGRLQEIEKHLRSLDGAVRVLASVDRGVVKAQIERAFADPRAVLVYRGLEAGLTQSEIAHELEARHLTGGQQPFVSRMLRKLADAGFVEKPVRGGQYHSVDGWEAFGLHRTLKAVLKANGIDDIA